MNFAQEMGVRQGHPKRVARALSVAELHSEIALCERIMCGCSEDVLPGWRRDFYHALLEERYLRPPILEPVDEAPDLDIDVDSPFSAGPEL